MGNVLCKQIKKVILTPSTIIIFILGYIILLEPLFSTIKSSLYFHVKVHYGEYIYSTYTASFFFLFAPIIAAFPSASDFCNDYNSGYIKHILLRTTKNKYIIKKIIAASLSGGIILCVLIAFQMLFIFLIGKPYLAIDTVFGYYTNTVLEPFEFGLNGMTPGLVSVGLGFIFGVLWSSIGLTISVYIPNKYFSIAGPLFLYLALHLLCNNIDVLRIFSPVNLILPTLPSIPSFHFILIEQLITLIIVIVIFWIGIKRRLKNV